MYITKTADLIALLVACLSTKINKQEINRTEPKYIFCCNAEAGKPGIGVSAANDRVKPSLKFIKTNGSRTNVE